MGDMCGIFVGLARDGVGTIVMVTGLRFMFDLELTLRTDFQPIIHIADVALHTTNPGNLDHTCSWL